MKFKVGDKVRNKYNHSITDVVESVLGMQEYDIQGYGYADDGFVLEKRGWDYQEQWELATPRTIQDGLREGDVVVDKYGEDEVKVLGICGDIIFLSETNYLEASDSIYTLHEIIDLGYTLKTDEQTPKKMTVKEIAEELGYKVEVVEE